MTLLKVLPEVEYNHFLILSVAVRICSCNKYKAYIPIASKLFKIYIETYINIYGRHSISSNVHNLIHISEDMQRCDVGNLMEISTYKFENCLRLLSLKLKHTNLPLEQVARRIIEKENLDNLLEKTCILDSEQFKPKTFYESRHENRSVF